MIKNYPVQGFATADLVPIACVMMHKIMQAVGCKSLFINTVHDNLVIDVHPEEILMLTDMLKESMLSLRVEVDRRYGVDYDMPVGIELKIGDNWLEMETVFEC
jgi:DNA polymerase I-like protein with 3'-5' exonuclease and polymerase domains